MNSADWFPAFRELDVIIHAYHAEPTLFTTAIVACYGGIEKMERVALELPLRVLGARSARRYIIERSRSLAGYEHARAIVLAWLGLEGEIC